MCHAQMNSCSSQVAASKLKFIIPDQTLDSVPDANF